MPWAAATWRSASRKTSRDPPARPLLYPDLALSQLIYIKRVAGNVFYDYGKVGNLLYRSTGVEAVFDLNFLHFPYNFRFGVRYAYRIDFGNGRIQPFVAFNW